MRNLFTFALLMLLSTGLAGCKDKSKLSGLAPCSGTVMMDGQPVEGAFLVFFATGGGTDMRNASGRTDAQGKFTLTTLSPNDGITPGDFAVAVSKNEEYGPIPKPVIDENGVEFTPERPTRNLLPAKYASAKTSQLKFTIPEGGNKNLEIVLEK